MTDYRKQLEVVAFAVNDNPDATGREITDPNGMTERICGAIERREKRHTALCQAVTEAMTAIRTGSYEFAYQRLAVALERDDDVGRAAVARARGETP